MTDTTEQAAEGKRKTDGWLRKAAFNAPLWVAIGFGIAVTLGMVAACYPRAEGWLWQKPGLLMRTMLGKDSTLRLERGKTCTQDRSECIESFNLRSRGFVASDGARFEEKLRALMGEHTTVDTVCLDSPGGENEGAAQIAKVIKVIGLKTCVGDMPLAGAMLDDPAVRYTARCESACVLILLAGKERIAVGERFVIGLHAARTLNEAFVTEAYQTAKGSGVGYMSKEAGSDVENQYRGNLAVSDETLKRLIAETVKTPGDRMYYASVAEQMQMEIFTSRLAAGGSKARAEEAQTGHSGS